MKKFAVAGAILLSISSVPATAMDYSWRPYNDKIVIDAVGEIKVDEAKVLLLGSSNPADNGTGIKQPLSFSILVEDLWRVEEKWG